jgi:predicted MFS family arabinose efflux permease
MLPALAVLRREGAAPMFAAGMLGRSAIGLAPLGVTLMVVGRTQSYALAGAVGAASTLSSAAAGRYTSRLVDRHGQSRMIPRLLAGHVLASLALVASVLLGAPTPLWFVCAALSGALVVNLGAMTRARWARVVDQPQERSAAYALESMADEVAFMLGPPVATLLALTVAPVAPVLLGLVLLSTGALLLACQRRTEPAPAPSTARCRGRMFGYPGMAVLCFLTLLMGVVFGTNTLTTVAFAEAIGRPELTGLLLATFPAAALLGGAVLSAVPRRWSLAGQIRLALLGLVLALLPLPFVTSAAVFAGAALLAGLSVPAIMVGVFSLVPAVVPRARLTEALALSVAGITVGVATGSTLAGAIIDAHGPQWAFPVSAVAAVLAVAWFSARHGVVRAAERAEAVPGQGRVGAESPVEPAPVLARP